MRIETNKLLNPTQRTIKNWNSDFMTSDGPNTSSFLSLGDLAIPYDSQYVSRIVLPADAKNVLLNYDSVDGSTFLLIKVIYNGDYDYPQQDDYDPLYNQESNNYNIEYYFDDNSGITYPIGRLLILNGSFTNKLSKIYLNNPLGYNVVLDVLQANLEAPSVHIPSSSAITISNLYYSDVITNQVICSSTGFTGTTTGSTEFIISEFKPFFTGFTISQYTILYSAITSIFKDVSINTIYLSTAQYYTLKFLTSFDCNQTYSRMMFAYSSYSGVSCRFLTIDNVYIDGSAEICSTYGVDNKSPIIYYNSGETWKGSGTTIPYDIFITTGLTLDNLKMLFINKIIDCFDGNIQQSSIIFNLFKNNLSFNEISENGIYNIFISVTDNSENNIINYIPNIIVDDLPPVIVYQPYVLSGITGSTIDYSGVTGITSGITILSGFTFNTFYKNSINRDDIISNIVNYAYDYVDSDVNKYKLDVLIVGNSGGTIAYNSVTQLGKYCIKFSISDKSGNEIINYFLMKVIYDKNYNSFIVYNIVL